MRTTFAGSFGSHMVLQRAPQRAVLWGFTDASGGAISIALGTLTVLASLHPYNASALTWRAVLPPTVAANGTNGSPVSHTLRLLKNGTVRAQLDDVLFGDVWVCSGQSNMAFLLEMDMDGARLVQEANHHPSLRFFTTRKLTSNMPLHELPCVSGDTDPGGCTEEPWSVSSNVSVSDHRGSTSLDDDWLYMSAVCYLYGLELLTALGVPVGLVNTNWGGTVIEDWLPAAANAECTPHAAREMVEAEAEAEAETEVASAAAAVGRLEVSTHLYNAMVAPLLNLTIRGVVWYQGESNAQAPHRYACQIQALVRHWRRAWHEGSGGETSAAFPFGIVQLAGSTSSNDTAATFGFTALRWAQTAGLGTLPNARMPHTFLATTYDLGDATSPYGSVHTRYKQEIARRLGLSSRAVAYGDSSVFAGPRFVSASLDKAAATVTLQLADTGEGGMTLTPMRLSAMFPQARALCRCMRM